MQLVEVLSVLAELRSAGCQVWIAGGWGVDALVGRQTRVHRDLDLAVNAEDEMAVVRVLERRGYRIETDWRPVRVELTAERRGWVDLHPVVFDSDGDGRQADFDGRHFDYPAAAFVKGVLDGVQVPCLSRRQQVRFHTGYPPRGVDRHDLRLLEQGFDRTTPRQR
jgi:lincosamide nucleotidyltransferase A/C/D/E